MYSIYNTCMGAGPVFCRPNMLNVTELIFVHAYRL